MPTDFAAMWNRGEPYTPSRSTKAMAGISSSFARDTRSSGREAPSRKLNADEEWSSTYFNRRFLPRTSASLAGPCRRGTPQSLRHFPGYFLIELFDATAAPRCPIHRVPTSFPTTNHLSFSTVRRTPGFACVRLRNQETSAFLPENQRSPEAQAGKCASQQYFAFLRRRVFPSFPVRQNGFVEKNRDHAYRAEPAPPLGLPQLCFGFERG